jgi:hypothetical protein
MGVSGFIIERDGASGRQVAEMPTYRCCHCKAHFSVVAGSGVLRGWCFKCNEPLCGKACAVLHGHRSAAV